MNFTVSLDSPFIVDLNYDYICTLLKQYLNNNDVRNIMIKTFENISNYDILIFHEDNIYKVEKVKTLHFFDKHRELIF